MSGVVIAGPEVASPVPLIFSQATPAASWPISHGLGHYPQVTVVDPAGNRMLPDLAYADVNTVTIVHASPLAGAAYLL